MHLKSLTYTSHARLDLNVADLDAIHVSARHLNALDGITGLLLFDGVRFLQIIEGPEEGIDALVERLRRDPRHSSLEVRDERIVDARSFPDWSMELVRIKSGFREAHQEIATALPPQTSAAIRDLVLKMAGALSAAD